MRSLVRFQLAPHVDFPPGFFDRADPSPDPAFYRPLRFVTHIDDGAIAAVGALYDELGIGVGGNGEVLDLMSSWVSHFTVTPRHLTVLGMNDDELAANPQAQARVVHDLNVNPALPFPDASFDAAVCCVSVDYLVQPIEVFTEVARVVRPAGSSCAPSRTGASRPRRSGAGCTPPTPSTARSWPSTSAVRVASANP